ncbi:GNAT family N-acetyltransferase [Saccharopolyspora endophytica]|uniref:GNAT family N-acetyltransferase n=1 Tax=Saccharopolyspora endophytica TaxID=543886 RepID=A0ABS5DI51_9PSEU|nr:GNAT family N-acetyltransferase [Saccharopolyspora endophytica]MBQ0925978.1 GNAT family N-acetyltransferase [Saccharopolyspora endophytica]
MQELRTAAEVAEVTSDLMVRWAAQALEPEYPHERGAAWRSRNAVVVFAPRLNRADRVVHAGDEDDVVALLREVLPGLTGPKVRLLAAAPLASRVSERLGHEVLATFGWLHLDTTAPQRPTPDVEWLTGADVPAIDALLREASPGSYLFPDDPGAVRWAGIRDTDGTPISIAGDSWPAPGLRYVSGVATHPAHRGRGLSTQVCTFVTRELAALGAVTLMADADNEPALKVYKGLGFRYSPISASRGGACPG